MRFLEAKSNNIADRELLFKSNGLIGGGAIDILTTAGSPLISVQLGELTTNSEILVEIDWLQFQNTGSTKVYTHNFGLNRGGSSSYEQVVGFTEAVSTGTSPSIKNVYNIKGRFVVASNTTDYAPAHTFQLIRTFAIASSDGGNQFGGALGASGANYIFANFRKINPTRDGLLDFYVTTNTSASGQTAQLINATVEKITYRNKDA